ncbi:MAG: DUF4249 domain-containing protein [Bacteroidales bacterium]|nr:DUF4249 domain-containing protein [Bacteroidales bacterium]
MKRYWSLIAIITFMVTSCEEVIEIDLSFNDPAFVIEGVISKDSVCVVRLTATASYFSEEDPVAVEDALVSVSNGTISEELSYYGDGYFRGENITGEEGSTYYLEVKYKETLYEASSYLPAQTNIISINYSKSNGQSTVNPLGETVFSIGCTFRDNPETDDFYMIRFTEDGKMIESKYCLLTERRSNGGSMEIDSNGYIRFSESIFYEGGEVDIHLFSIDENIYNYFMQLSDILFWKRRVVPPTPYNPQSNITGGALGYFAAWAFDSETILLE